MQESAAAYPATLSVDYPDRDLNRLTSFFRIFMAIPIAIILYLLAGRNAGNIWVALPTLLMLLFRQKYPRWWFDWNLAMTNFINRVSAYVYLLTDEYPSTDEEQSVHVAITYPDARLDLNRWMPLVKWLLAVPHYVVLFFLGIGVLVSLILAWFAILFTGRYPRGLFDFVVGVMRWNLRLSAYMALLATDRYPPFSLK